MITLDMAKRLKEAGLTWEPQEGDWYYDTIDNSLVVVGWGETTNEVYMSAVKEQDYFAPRLDQLLSEIEKRGYMVDSIQQGPDWYVTELWKYPDQDPETAAEKIHTIDEGFINRDDSAALALEWILTRECKQPEPEEPLTQEEMARRALEYLT